MKDQRLYDRILAQVSKNSAAGCWLWTGSYHKSRPHAANRYGYIGMARGNGKYGSVDTHRAMWIAIHGELPSIVYVCHRCDVPLCVNPEHLFLGAPRDNTRDMLAKNRHNNGKKTICKRGHALEGDNVYICPAGARDCKICATARYRIRAGWPEHLAYSIGKVPPGYKLDFVTGELVAARSSKRRQSQLT